MGGEMVGKFMLGVYGVWGEEGLTFTLAAIFMVRMGGRRS
jgi:hypothetical protein